MGKFPGFFYEALGTALFVTVSSRVASDVGMESALFFGLSWALLHITFKDNTQAFFNPVLTIAHWVAKGGDIADVIVTILGQFIGSFTAVGFMSAIGAGSIPDYAHADSEFQVLVYEILLSAILAKFFLSQPSDSKLSGAFWYALVFATLTMVGGHKMNPARYAGDMFAADDFSGPSGNDVMVILGSVMGAIIGAVCHKHDLSDSIFRSDKLLGA